jgi:hypothetical protein
MPHTLQTKQVRVRDYKFAEAIKKSDAPRANQIATDNMIK